MLIEKFLSFPDAENFPSGVYDLDTISFELDQWRLLEVILHLGWVYDTYLLRIVVDTSVDWELWHDSSAVSHIEQRKVAHNPFFHYIEFSIPYDMQLNVDLEFDKVSGRVVKIHFQPAVPELVFVIAFEFETGSFIGLCAKGWRLFNTTKPDDSWPSDEWKDWNTM
ncbi:MAG TPA: hypothetical protein PK079_10390 [Leptospiraceae bacterium]|nr:hypothetical protein [Leptospiraceae bacterium]HMW06168.1 hypothetical protein [Leptospiraceae bacterium]HMX30704.1 hypothetical protein [Leptospiraceae bacterium]HMY31829.1 hypothetical protein [Leptospiraceae bacterium]HMZ64945.1 hypothetical protein [Leptospiraceae bacterium]